MSSINSFVSRGIINKRLHLNKTEMNPGPKLNSCNKFFLCH